MSCVLLPCRTQAKALSKSVDKLGQQPAAGSKRGRPGAADFFDGEDRAAGGKAARVGFDQPEDKEWVAPPPMAAAEQAGGSAQAAAAAGADAVQQSVLPADNSVWEQKAPQQEATAEEDFDSYLENMFL